ncbi:MAG TPA: PLP-dependent transferase, partial [Geomonas sp.]
MSKDWRIETQAIQEGYTPQDGEPRILPIIQSTTFKFSNADHVARLFDLEVRGHFYSRLSNPTAEGFEKKITAMEGGVAAMATSSGQAATSIALMNICRAGQHIVAASALYGGTYSLFANTFPKLG